MKSKKEGNIKRFLKRVKAWFSKFREDNLEIVIGVCVLVLVIFILFLLNIKKLDRGTIRGNILGLCFNILVFGILIVIFNKMGNKKRDIKRYREEIDDYRGWHEPQATFRIIGNIRRLNRLGVSKINLRECFLKLALLKDVNLKEAGLVEADLEGANLDHSNLEKVCLAGANIKKACFNFANLQEAVLSDGVPAEAAEFWEANLSYANLTRGHFTGANFNGANLEGADLSYSDASRASFCQANMRKAKLHSVLFPEANFNYADLQEAIVGGSHYLYYRDNATIFHEAVFVGANLNKTDLSIADLTGADLREASLLEAKNLTVEQLSKVKTLYQAKLDSELEQQIKEKYPHLLEKPRE
jgi:uncharacterized protein YjbI with pentapeptide repeats